MIDILITFGYFVLYGLGFGLGLIIIRSLIDKTRKNVHRSKVKKYIAQEPTTGKSRWEDL
jgi:hypothetical protein